MSVPAEKKRGELRRSAERAERSEPASDALRARALSYALALFLGSTLLFLLEPIAAKRLVPLLGGSAAVWTTCLVFFQTALLLGYYLAHLLVTRTSPRTQAGVYVGLLALSAVQLALVVDPALHADVDRPIVSVLWSLSALIGLPFVTLSATSPLLQAWFARTTPRGRADAYQLFAISNVGSIAALLAYPWLIEPRLTLRAQTILVTVVLALLAILAGVIGASVRRDADDGHAAPTTEALAAPLTTRALWLALAACASLLLAATTTHISQNVAALPLVWIIPLVAYLLSFVVAFSARAWLPRWLVVSLAIAGLLLSADLVERGVLAVRIIPATAAFCGALFVLCLFLHRELYLRRPAPRQLTSFYFHVAAGGALGAVLVGIVAPLVLPGNYDVAIGLLLTTVLGLVAAWPGRRVMRVVWALLLVDQIALVASQVDNDSDAVVQVRNFYGTLRVTQEHAPPRPDVRSLYHGVIVHGRQVFRLDWRHMPNTYYARTSGLGLALDHCCAGRPRRIGVIGLGAGTVAIYGIPGDTIRFYEINEAVEDIAKTYFTYLGDSPAVVQIVRGDARVSLAAESPQRYDVLVVDAFSGDAIPAHLLTAQALEVYRRQLAAGGIIAFNVSNDFLALAPVLEQLARHAGMQAVRVIDHEDPSRGVFDSEWVLITTNAGFVADPAIARARTPIEVPAGLRLWTDDYSSLFPIIKLRQRLFWAIFHPASLRSFTHRGPLMATPAKNTICLWYDHDAEDAARFYAETFPDSSVNAVHHAPGDSPSGKQGDVLTVEFTVLGIPCLGLNGGPTFKHTEAFSFQVATVDQAETDRYWNAIVGNGGEESACGWCKDRWGLSWQISPIALMQAITDPDRAAAKRAFDAMMQMGKIDIATIEAARHG